MFDDICQNYKQNDGAKFRIWFWTNHYPYLMVPHIDLDLDPDVLSNISNDSD